MNAINKAWLLLGAMALVLVMGPASYAQVNSNNATVTLTANMVESLSVSASPSAVTFTLAASGPATGSAPVVITTTWTLAKTRTNVKLYAYFSGTNALTDGGGDNIPAANVTGNLNGGGANPFTAATPFSTSGLTLFTQAITATNDNSSHGPDSLVLIINSAGLALPAATYTGVLNIQAQAT